MDVKLDSAEITLTCPIATALIPWAVRGLSGRLTETGDQLIVDWPGRVESMSQNTNSAPPGRISAKKESWNWDGHALNSLLAAVGERQPVLAAPCQQPQRLHEFSGRLLAPYSAAGGHVHLGGCTLNWIPFWKRFCVTQQDGEPVLQTELFANDGQEVDEQVIEQAGLNQLSPLERAPSPQVLAPPNVESSSPIVLQMIVWCCWVTGKVEAEIGDASLSVEFEGWGREIANGSRTPPPFALDGCPATSHHAALDDAGDIGPADAIANCCESNQRLLQSKMICCSVSHQWAAKEFFTICPVLRTQLRTAELKDCNMCRQSVSPPALRGGRCQVCRTLSAVSKEDAVLARLIGEFPRFDRWSSWKLGESETTYVLTAGALLHRLLVVVRKEPLELIRVATGLRWLGGWHEAANEVQREIERDSG